MSRLWPSFIATFILTIIFVTTFIFFIKIMVMNNVYFVSNLTYIELLLINEEKEATLMFKDKLGLQRKVFLHLRQSQVSWYTNKKGFNPILKGCMRGKYYFLRTFSSDRLRATLKMHLDIQELTSFRYLHVFHPDIYLSPNLQKWKAIFRGLWKYLKYPKLHTCAYLLCL